MSRFENLNVVVAEPSASLRKKLIQVLRDLGFKDIEATGNLSTVVELIKNGDVDLLIGDTKMPEGDLSDIIHDIRHMELGPQPFMVIITLMSDSSEAALTKVINAGVDAVLTKPFNPADLSERILALTHTRKRFVVTVDYIGPDRRANQRVGGIKIPLIDVPNPLRIKVTGQMNSARLTQAVSSAKKVINEQKTERYAYQINWLIERILPDDFDDESGELIVLDEENLEFLKSLDKIANDMSVRLLSTRYRRIAEMCMSFKSLNKMIMGNPDGSEPRDLSLLSKLGLAVQGALDRERGLEDMGEDVQSFA